MDRETDQTGNSSDPEDGDVLAGGEFTEELSENEAEADRASGATEGAAGEGGGRLAD